MYTYKLTIAYDGTAYSGWQIQPNALSIQQLILEKLILISRMPDLHLVGSGRTDAGVHAEGQTAHFRCEHEIDIHKFLHSLNGVLPKDIRILKMELVDNEFHARYSAIGKEYHYYIHLDRIMDPFRRHYCWHVHQSIDLQLLNAAKNYFLGIHDFTSFSNEAHRGSASRDAVRHLTRLDCCPIKGGIRLEFEGEGFLYKMVRNIVGTLIEVAAGNRDIKGIPLIFSAKDRRAAGAAAPPQGLFLVCVKY